MPRFAANTTIHLPSGESERFSAGDDIPSNILELIHNPALIAKEDAPEVDEDNYQRMSVRALLAEAAQRGIQTESTRKADVIAVLREDDANILR